MPYFQLNSSSYALEEFAGLSTSEDHEIIVFMQFPDLRMLKF